jgi:O-antigen/teichoic acid export membrane protein/D-alanine-D-alanine ligase-like ATP-grasp enzyme
VSDGTGPEIDAGAVAANAAHVRGSTLLVTGRLLSLGINLGTQIIVARYLGQAEFGAFALAFAIAGLGQVAITLGLHRGVTRFLTADLERADHPRLLGTIVLNVAVIVGLGALLIAFIAVAQGALVDAGILQPAATALLLILVLLAPIDALDDLLISLYAIFDSPRAIFIRRYVLAPALRLGVALLVVLAHGGALQLAVGYVAAGVLGLVLYGALFIQLLARQGILPGVGGRDLVVPAREVLGASVPLLSTDAVWLLINTFPIFVLTAASGLVQVAEYQVIRPAAALNLLVAASFHVLYLPLATRLANRSDRAGTNELYWRTTIWVAVLTFPVFAATFALGRPLAGFAFGERYESSGLYLSVLSIGYIVHAALGFNATTLAAYGRHRTVAIANGITAAVSVGAAVLLIPPLGAFGAALASTATLLSQNVLLQFALRRHVGVELIHRDAVRVYAVIAITAGGLFAIESYGAFGLWTLALASIAAVAVFYLARHALQIGTVFPGVHALIVRLITPTGHLGRRVGSGVDLVRSVRPDHLYGRLRQGRQWAAQGASARAAVYRSIWTEASGAIDADVEEIAPGTFELQSGSRRTVVTDHSLRLDPPQALARALDKPAVAAELRANGMPTPEQLPFRFGDHGAADAFLAAADGPCVIKPAHGRTGSGVTANVRTPDDLLRAVIRAGADSDELLIERQLEGLVYRLLFLDGHLLDVLERRAPRVVGDGRSSVASLIEAENERRLQASGWAGLSLLKVDLDCQLTLSSSGRDLCSVPAAGTVVEVKTATNQNGAVDNRSVLGAVGAALVEQSRMAVEIVGLRLAGVDVITTDVRVPLAATGGAILEVNGLPGIHYHYLVHPDSEYRPVAIPIVEALLELEPGRGRMRVKPGFGSERGVQQATTTVPPNPAGV